MVHRIMLLILFFTITAVSANAENTGKKCKLVIGSSSREYTESIDITFCKKEISDYSYGFLKGLLLKENVPNYLSIDYGDGTFSKEMIILHSGEQPDSDNDGLSDSFEKKLGTKPYVADSDDDGIQDGKEYVAWGEHWKSDFDGDGVINLLDSDSDNDGIQDGYEHDTRRFFFLTLAPSIVKSISWLSEDTDIEFYKVFIRKKGKKYDFSSPAWQGIEKSCKIVMESDNSTVYVVIRAYDKIGQKSPDSEEIELTQ